MENIVTCITEGIRVSVRSAYQINRSSPQEHYYLFAYEVEIHNASEATVQLLRREWNIYDGVGTHREVKGDGVIGKQPVIEPGQTHKYVSFCDFATMAGTMNGYYDMHRFSDDKEIRIKIPEFEMIVPFIFN